jgi:hypothetical protein
VRRNFTSPLDLNKRNRPPLLSIDEVDVGKIAGTLQACLRPARTDRVPATYQVGAAPPHSAPDVRFLRPDPPRFTT